MKSPEQSKKPQNNYLNPYDVVIGLEVHVQLKTCSKLFCGCSASYSNDKPNTHVCPVCFGLPGVLPVLNKSALEFGLMTCMALNCRIPQITRFDRKHYFYPDLPKGYQISQFDQPIGKNGCLLIENQSGETIKIGINRIHMEEDAGKLIHTENGNSLIDYNRSSMPLLEIVSEPHISNQFEACAYLKMLRLTLQYLGVSDGDMENGTLRCDVNISLRKNKTEPYGQKVEIKNLNSFKSVAKSINYEISRQHSLLENNQAIMQQTVLWNDETGKTMVMRTKEDANDYRYFPEPDIPPLKIDSNYLDSIREKIPELPGERFIRLSDKYKLPNEYLWLFVENPELGNFFEKTCLLYKNQKTVLNWITTELLGELSRRSQNINNSKFRPEHIAELLDLIESGAISAKIAKRVLSIVGDSGNNPRDIVEEKQFSQISDISYLKEYVKQSVENNPSVIEELSQGKMKSFDFLMGQIMRASKGKANPQKIREILSEYLKNNYHIEI
jgi:aspartyl-tRNA(Asn)/glutamyl-tRNA(Gln) amidotransferase subunit B